MIRVLTVVFFVAIMAVWAAAWTGFIHWLPKEVSDALLFVAVGFLVGCWRSFIDLKPLRLRSPEETLVAAWR